MQIDAVIDGLNCGTTYTYYGIGINSAGTNVGQWQTFKTSQCISLNAPVITAESIGDALINTAVLLATVNTNGLPTTVSFLYGTNSASLVSTPAQPILSSMPSGSVAIPIEGLSCNTSYIFYATATSSAGTSFGQSLSFRTWPCSATPPLVTNQSVDNITQTSASFHGGANPNGQATYVRIEYGTGLSSSVTLIPPPAIFIGSGTSSVPFSVDTTDLSCGTTYFYHAVAISSVTGTGGANLSFTTAPCGAVTPQVTTGSVDGITQSAAIFHGVVNPNGSNTNAWFEYGLDTNYDYVSGFQAVGQGSASLSYTEAISGPLQCGAVYHCRAVARNDAIAAYGLDMTFSTLSCANSSPSVVIESIDGVTK
ncbi:MAG: hypothetical protein WAM82_26220 [Thermoanaerobaculia bacterium]